MIETIKTPLPGQEFSARELRRQADQVEASDNVYAAGQLDVFRAAGGVQIIDKFPKRIWVKITGGTNPYSWVQQQQQTPGTWSNDPDGLVGYALGDAANAALPLYEINNLACVPAGSVWSAWPHPQEEHYLFSAAGKFQARLTSRGQVAVPTHGSYEVIHTTYGWVAVGAAGAPYGAWYGVGAAREASGSTPLDNFATGSPNNSYAIDPNWGTPQSNPAWDQTTNTPIQGALYTDCDFAADVAAQTVTNQVAAAAAAAAGAAAYTLPTSNGIAMAVTLGHAAFLAAGGTVTEADRWASNYAAYLPVGGVSFTPFVDYPNAGGTLVWLSLSQQGVEFEYPTLTCLNLTTDDIHAPGGGTVGTFVGQESWNVRLQAIEYSGIYFAHTERRSTDPDSTGVLSHFHVGLFPMQAYYPEYLFTQYHGGSLSNGPQALGYLKYGRHLGLYPKDTRYGTGSQNAPPVGQFPSDHASGLAAEHLFVWQASGETQDYHDATPVNTSWETDAAGGNDYVKGYWPRRSSHAEFFLGSCPGAVVNGQPLACLWPIRAVFDGVDFGAGGGGYGAWETSGYFGAPGWAGGLVSETVQIPIGDGTTGIQLHFTDGLLTDNTTYSSSDSGAGTWKSFTKTYSDLATAAMNNDVLLYTLPAKGFVNGAILKHSAAFTGGALTDYVVSVGIATNNIRYTLLFDVWQAPASNLFAKGTSNANQPDVLDFSSATQIRLYASSSSANLDQATQGSVTVYLLIGALP